MIKRSKRWKKLQRESHLGNKMSEATKSKMAIAHMGKPSNAIGKHWKLSKKNKLNQSRANRKRIIDGNHNWWMGGVSKINNLIRNMPEYIQWRSNIFKRDDWTCKTCNVRGRKELHAHHIKSFVSIIRQNKIKTVSHARKCKELWDEKNGITLCMDCHKLTDNYGHKGRSIGSEKVDKLGGKKIN
jgi:hypothetical protein